MKEIFVIIIFLFSHIEFYAQSKEKDNCFDYTRYEVKSNISYFPELKIKIKGEWKTFELIDERAERFDFECEEIQLNGKGSKELVIRWSNAVYGSGGGYTAKGIQIWDLDSGTRLLNEIVSCSDESFGKQLSSSYFVECQKQIQIEGRTIIVFEKNCKTEWSNTEEVSDPTLNCELTRLEEGEYTIVNDNLKRK
ncbi:MAG: hypothetical protein LAT51_05440 [Flavobacteriaceae bacterium]|nr:hypothetical protein [Flavobacteriaceae bacterium]